MPDFSSFFDRIWLAIVASVAVTVIATTIFYFVGFRPSAGDVARRLDRTGQDERMITMLQYQGDESFIAGLQRADAAAKLSALDTKMIRLHLSLAAIVTVVVAFVLSAGMTGVSVLAKRGIISSGEALINPPIHLEVNYEAEAGGMIEGDIAQIVLKGESADPVFAVAEEGWLFYMWSDGYLDPDRRDLKIVDNVTVTAIFIPMEQGDEGEGDDSGDEPADIPGDPGANDGDDGDPGKGDGAGGKYEGFNQIYDGSLYYRDVYEENYYSAGMNESSGNSNLSDGQRDATGGYLEAIK